MTPAETSLVVLAILIIAGVALSSLARRLDALHKRVVSTQAVLETQLVRRAELGMKIAMSGSLDEASTVLVAEAAWQAGVHARRLHDLNEDNQASTLGELAAQMTAGGVDRGAAESEFTRALRAALGDAADRERIAAATPDSAALLEDLRAACYRVQLAHRFHNEAVDAVHRLRSTWTVRTFRLAGRAALPEHFAMDDAVLSGPDGGVT